MRGRKPIPTVLSKLHGHPGRRMHSEHEPRLAFADRFPVPDHLSDDAAREWQRVVIELQALKIITVLDLSLLAAFCTSVGDYVAAERMLRQEGLVTDSRDRGL